MSDTLIAAIRTAVPLAVGWLVGWLGTRGVTVDQATEAALVAGVTSLAAAAYWALVNLIAAKWPAAQWLLGVPKAPVYPDSDERADQPHDDAARPASGILTDADPPQDQVPQDPGDHSEGPRVES